MTSRLSVAITLICLTAPMHAQTADLAVVIDDAGFPDSTIMADGRFLHQSGDPAVPVICFDPPPDVGYSFTLDTTATSCDIVDTCDIDMRREAPRSQDRSVMTMEGNTVWVTPSLSGAIRIECVLQLATEGATVEFEFTGDFVPPVVPFESTLRITIVPETITDPDPSNNIASFLIAGPIFGDGFESGDIGAWSSSVP